MILQSGTWITSRQIKLRLAEGAVLTAFLARIFSPFQGRFSFRENFQFAFSGKRKALFKLITGRLIRADLT